MKKLNDTRTQTIIRSRCHYQIVLKTSATIVHLAMHIHGQSDTPLFFFFYSVHSFSFFFLFFFLFSNNKLKHQIAQQYVHSTPTHARTPHTHTYIRLKMRDMQSMHSGSLRKCANKKYGIRRNRIIMMMMLSDNKNAILRIIRKSNICRR